MSTTDRGGPECRDSDGTSDARCAICLDRINDGCCAETCEHSFCFECLKRWAAIQPVCPLCKRKFTSIRHSFTVDGSCRIYDVPSSYVGGGGSSSGEYSPALERIMRGLVYNQNMWAEPLADPNGNYRGVNAGYFREHPARARGLREFVLRDVSVLMDIRRHNGTRSRLDGQANIVADEETVTNLVVRSVSRYEITSDGMAAFLRPFLGRHTAHFCHELFVYANSLYDNVIDYDMNVSHSGNVDDPSFIDDGPFSIREAETIMLLYDDDDAVTGPRGL